MPITIVFGEAHPPAGGTPATTEDAAIDEVKTSNRLDTATRLQHERSAIKNFVMEWARSRGRGNDRSPEFYVSAFARRRLATRFSAPPATISSCAAGLSGGKANDFPSTVRMDSA